MRLRRQLDLAVRYLSEFVRYRRGGGDIYALERLAQLLAQLVFDLAAMVATALGEGKPDTYRGLAGYISSKAGLAEEDRGFLEGLAGFRNILVHAYAEIDRRLEERAFREIEEKMPRVLERLRSFVEGLEVDPELLSELGGVFEKYKVKYAVLFGSRAREGSGRDYDLSVSGEFDSYIEVGKMLVEIAEALGVPEDEIDIVLVDSAPLHLIHTIVSEGKIVYGDRDLAVRELSSRYVEYIDVNEAYRIARERLRSEEASSP